MDSVDPRLARNAEIVARIVDDRVRTEHLLRCLVQGCHCPPLLGGRCQYCGELRYTSATTREAGETAHV